MNWYQSLNDQQNNWNQSPQYHESNQVYQHHNCSISPDPFSASPSQDPITSTWYSDPAFPTTQPQPSPKHLFNNNSYEPHLLTYNTKIHDRFPPSRDFPNVEQPHHHKPYQMHSQYTTDNSIIQDYLLPPLQNPSGKPSILSTLESQSHKVEIPSIRYQHVEPNVNTAALLQTEQDQIASGLILEQRLSGTSIISYTKMLNENPEQSSNEPSSIPPTILQPQQSSNEPKHLEVAELVRSDQCYEQRINETLGIVPNMNQNVIVPNMNQNVILEAHRQSGGGIFNASNDDVDEDEFEVMLRQPAPDFSYYQFNYVSNETTTSLHDSHLAVDHTFSTAAIFSTEPTVSPSTIQTATSSSLQETPIQYSITQPSSLNHRQMDQVTMSPHPEQRSMYNCYQSVESDSKPDDIWNKSTINESQEFHSGISQIMMNENLCIEPESDLGETTKIEEENIENHDLNLPWTVFSTLSQNIAVHGGHPSDVVDPSTAPESCPILLEAHIQSPIDGHSLISQHQLPQSDTPQFSTDKSSDGWENISVSPAKPCSTQFHHPSSIMHSGQPQFYFSPPHHPPPTARTTAILDQSPLSSTAPVPSTPIPLPQLPYQSINQSDSHLHEDQYQPSLLSTPQQIVQPLDFIPLDINTSKPLTSPQFLRFTNPFDQPNETHKSNERKQTKEMAFYSGAHPALRGNTASVNAVTPTVSFHLKSSISFNTVPSIEQHSNNSSSTDQQSDQITTESLISQPCLPGSQEIPIPNTPGDHTKIVIGLEGRAFVFDSLNQLVDLSVALAAARSSLTSIEHQYSNERSQASTAILDGLQSHHGPLRVIPIDKINRLIDFYIDCQSQSIIESKGKDKDLILWILLKHIIVLRKYPSFFELDEVLKFLYDCSLISHYLNLIDDKLPKLQSNPSTCLPSTFPTCSPSSEEPPPIPSTAWADCCRKICSGQAAEAVAFAMNFGMWGHALSTALLVSPECFNAVRVEYAASLNVFGQPKKPQYLIKSSDGPPTSPGPFEALHLDCVRMLFFLHALPAAIQPQDALETEKVFREMLHGIDDLSSTWLTRIRINILYLGLGHPNCRLWLKALGKELVERKEVTLGHCCLILSGSIPCKDFGLLGCEIPIESYLDVSQGKKSTVNFDWKRFQLTEFYEVILANVSSNDSLFSYFDVPKFLYSRILRISGHHDMADSYITQINPQTESLLSRAIENETPSLKRPTTKQDNASRLGHGFGLSTLIRSFLNQD